MIILKTLLSGGSTTEPTEVNSVRSEKGRGGARSDAIIKGPDKHLLNRKMEFMYCIPDLEVFIDKTIKKCLLEYDLDANDTEAVLDDMEKAWPKSPPRHTEKQVLKDCNDNSQKGRNNRQISTANQMQEGSLLDAALEKDASKGGDIVASRVNVKDKDSRELIERLISKREERVNVVANGKREIERAIFEGDRSDTSSPDVTDGQLQARKHPKLKSLLQQRYFEGQESSNLDKGQPSKKSEEKLEESWSKNKHLPSNLDLLASAADIHTVSARATEEHRVQAIRRLQEESERQFQVSAAKRFPNNSHHESGASAESSGRMPVLLKLITSSSSSLPLPEFNNHDSTVATSHHNNNLKTVSPEICQRVSPSTSFQNDPHLPTISRPQERSSVSFLSRDRTQQPLQHHQNGFHSHTPQETIVIRRDISSPSEERSLKSKQISGLATHSAQTWDDTDQAARTMHFNNHPPKPRFQEHTQRHLDRPQNYSETLDPFCHHGSRIASIIAEELQKDDNRVHPQINLPVARTIPPERKPAAMHEPARIRSFSLPGTYKRITSMKSDNYLSQVTLSSSPRDMHYMAVGTNEAVGNSHSRTQPQLLPAHCIMTNTQSGRAIMASTLSHTTSARSCGIITNIRDDDDDQPQDLSTKSRRIAEDAHEAHYLSSSNQVSPLPDSETREHVLNTLSPLSAPDRVHQFESPSPCSHSDRECDYDTRSDNGNTSINTVQPERKGQVQNFDTYPAGAKNSQTLAKKRKPKTVKTNSGTGDTNSTKRRKI